MEQINLIAICFGNHKKIKDML